MPMRPDAYAIYHMREEILNASLPDLKGERAALLSSTSSPREWPSPLYGIPLQCLI